MMPDWHSQYSDQLQVGRPRVPIPMGTRDIYRLQIIQTGWRTHLTSYSVGITVLSRG